MRTTSLALVLLLFGRLDASAQPEHAAVDNQRAFVSGGAFLDHDYTWSQPAPAVIGWSLSAGLDVSHHVGLRFAVDVPQIATTRRAYASPTLRSTLTERHRSVAWSGLVDFHGQVSDRVRLGFVTGITDARRPDHFTSSSDELGPTGAVLQHTQSSPPYMQFTFSWWGYTSGAELPIALTNHIVVVPEARVILFPLADYGRTTIFRPGAVLRWRF